MQHSTLIALVFNYFVTGSFICSRIVTFNDFLSTIWLLHRVIISCPVIILDLCQGESNLYRCVNDQCVYTISYGGGSKTKGIASLESFTFANSRVVDNMIFGCSNDNQNIQFAQPGDGGAISGIMGLSFSPDSLVSQLSTEIKKQFSYCLVPFTEAMTAPSVVRFGIDIPRPPGNLQTTRFITPPPPPPPPGSFYYQLNLIDISVGPRRLGFSQDLFRIREDGFNNFVTFTYHFEGADYAVDGRSVNVYNTEKGYFHLAIRPGNTRTFLGAWHQQNKRIIYDANFGGIQFYGENCANDHLS
ncbi:hypothetical protein Q3G72_018975 [Acer saccharum]|nr:hypothetical protein Q3G72_018975 [Acer saccharum]